MGTYRYPAVLARQTPDSKGLVMFSASATEIDQWAGIPQKRQLGEGETVGFQREENPKRITQLAGFFKDKRNILQNPLLAAARDLALVKFVPSDGSDASLDQVGEITIEAPDLWSLPFTELLERIKQVLEDRVPELANGEVPPDNLRSIRLLSAVGQEDDLDDEEESEDDGGDLEEADPDEGEETTAESEQAAMAPLLDEESHIYEFWIDIAGRLQVLKELKREPKDDFIGFTREALIGYLQPAVIVDGQHRLLGALRTIDEVALSEEFRGRVEKLVLEGGEDADEVTARLRTEETRRLPVSLLLDPTPSEHVFQFVVVNQKATPVKPALLGTIVATSLSNAELENVADRLEMAKIPLQRSKVVAFLSRNEKSPFAGKVDVGFGVPGDRGGLLGWNVMNGIVDIFRVLEGGQIWGVGRIDHATIWRQRYLPSSAIAGSASDALEQWSQTMGPWMDVFITFFTEIRDFFGTNTVGDEEESNYWGNPTISNLFNKVSLTILAADFFSCLNEKGQVIDSVDQIRDFIRTEWLGQGGAFSVNPGYFNRDWNLAGVKKDGVGIRAQWGGIWHDYRRNPAQLPDKRLYRQPKVV